MFPCNCVIKYLIKACISHTAIVCHILLYVSSNIILCTVFFNCSYFSFGAKIAIIATSVPRFKPVGLLLIVGWNWKFRHGKLESMNCKLVKGETPSLQTQSDWRWASSDPSVASWILFVPPWGLMLLTSCLALCERFTVFYTLNV